MQFGVALPQFGRHARDPNVRERIRDVALAADRLGYDVVWTAEHLICPTVIETPYPYGGRAPFDATDPILDVSATLAFVAALTTRVRLGTGESTSVARGAMPSPPAIHLRGAITGETDRPPADDATAAGDVPESASGVNVTMMRDIGRMPTAHDPASGRLEWLPGAG